MLQLAGICKSFGPVRALHEVDLQIEPGEVLGLIGENGAGKSTLMNILGGILQPGAGSIRMDGQVTRIRDARHAEKLGISFVHQELNLLGNIDIAGNLFLGREPRKLCCIDRKALNEQARPLLESLGLKLEPTVSVAELTNGQQQMVEIAKALSRQAKVLILDEPTSSLTMQETQTLLDLVMKLKADGMAIIFITHRLSEIEIVADRVVALRDGENAGELSGGGLQRDRMISLMIGRDLSEVYPETKASTEEVVLEVEGLATKRWPQGDASFQIRAGEILGMAGLVGAGRSELAQALFGVDSSPAGMIRVNGEVLRRGSVKDAIAKRLFLAPEDRKASGLVLEMSIRENMTLNSMSGFSRLATINGRKERQQTGEWLREFSVKARDTESAVGDLSGGNQQKVVLAKWMTRGPRVMIFDEPTRGIDMGARSEIYQAISKLAAEGCAVLMISSDMEELLGLSHRIAVMSEGVLRGFLTKEEFSEEAIMHLAMEGHDRKPDLELSLQ